MRHCRRSISELRACLLRVGIAAVTCLAPVPALAAPQPGELLEVKVNTADGPLTMVFCYCSSGELLRGRPGFSKTPVRMKSFYISQWEVSQQDFSRVYDKAAAQQVVGRFPDGRGNEFPVRGVTVVEAAKFCDLLSKLDAQNPAARSGIEGRRFRIPSHDEWQYACRADMEPQQALSKPHFNVWPKDLPADLETLPDGAWKYALRDCRDVWKKLNKTTAFTGTQDQVIEIVEECSTTGNPEELARGASILKAFLQKALDSPNDYSAKHEFIQPVSKGAPNAWNVRNMHGNVSEWVVKASDANQFEKVQSVLRSGDTSQLDAAMAKVFFLAGGGYNDTLGENNQNWKLFCAWGGHPMKVFDSDRKERDAQSLADLNKVASDREPGIRVVMERTLSDDWLLVVREATVLNDKAAPGEVQKRLDELRGTIAELAVGDDLALAQSRIKFYEALLAYRAGQVAQGSQMLTESAAALEKDKADPYFAHMRKLVQADSQQ